MYKNNKLVIKLCFCGLVVLLTTIFSVGRAINIQKEQAQKPKEASHYRELIIYPLETKQPMPLHIVEKPKESENPKPFCELTNEERKVVECLVEGESGNQSLEGRILVAQCIYNAMAQDGLTPSQVRKKYKYVGWSDTPSEKSKEAVSAVFDRGEMGVEDNILWFCTIASSKRAKSFHATQEFVVEVGNHRFYKPMEN